MHGPNIEKNSHLVKAGFTSYIQQISQWSSRIEYELIYENISVVCLLQAYSPKLFLFKMFVSAPGAFSGSLRMEVTSVKEIVLLLS